MGIRAVRKSGSPEVRTSIAPSLGKRADRNRRLGSSSGLPDFRTSGLRSRAFTLIELLVVMTVIGILAGLLFTALPLLTFSARALETENRMNAVTHGLSALANGGKITQTLQARFPVGSTNSQSLLGGTIRFGAASSGTDYLFQDPGNAATYHRCWPDTRSSAGRPATIAASAAAYAAADLPLVMAYPWGRQRAYVVRQDWYEIAGSAGHPIPGWTPPTIAWPDLRGLYYNQTITTSSGAYQAFLMGGTNRPRYEQPEAHCLSHLRPFRSAELLYAAGVLPDLSPATLAREPRKKQPWNDSWGNPLVVSFALFQPPAYSPAQDPEQPPAAARTDATPANAYLEQAEKAYGYTRSFYLSVAAAGPKLAAPLTGIAKDDAIAIWKQANELCNLDQSGVELWRIDPFTAANPFNAMITPPWIGVRRGKGIGARKGQRCFLLAPIELQ
ncbi:MAG: type II secretion system protein [Planctomycetes bacterium]|nr:type II secretion system protein [Planctomycetota bacterium]